MYSFQPASVQVGVLASCDIRSCPKAGTSSNSSTLLQRVQIPILLPGSVQVGAAPFLYSISCPSGRSFSVSITFPQTLQVFFLVPVEVHVGSSMVSQTVTWVWSSSEAGVCAFSQPVNASNKASDVAIQHSSKISERFFIKISFFCF